MIGERYFKVMSRKEQNFVDTQEFLHTITKTFMSDLDSKIRLTFQMYKLLNNFRYDFDQDDEITREDVRIVLSYAHFERNRQKSILEINKSMEGSYFDRE